MSDLERSAPSQNFKRTIDSVSASIGVAADFARLDTRINPFEARVHAASLRAVAEEALREAVALEGVINSDSDSSKTEPHDVPIAMADFPRLLPPEYEHNSG